MAILRVGTSGYAYPAWRGSFYPANHPAGAMLGFYASRFTTVEINHTFYRMPVERTLRDWAAAVPAGFQFAVKLHQRLTHQKRLRDCDEPLSRFLEVVRVLAGAGQLGPLLIQLPPYFRADPATLDAFRCALEVRHASWLVQDTYAVLRAHGVALCLAETDETPAPPTLEILTAGFVYLRLRRDDYAPADLAAWRARCQAWVAGGLDVYAYFKHEDAGRGPVYARALLEDG
jgi:uncharacterized protein YecE (DUF72 family)